MGGDDSYSTTAAQRLRTLRVEHLTPTKRPSSSTRRATQSHSPALIDLDVLDHIEVAVHEMAAHTYTAVPTAGPAPRTPEAFYAWSEEVTAHLPAEKQQVRDALMLRQSLEHSLHAGDTAPVTAVVRFESCPTCRCWGLMWSRADWVVLCANRRCHDTVGLPSRWSLQQICERHVARVAALQRTAT
ncbi:MULTISPECIES: hypothetical protein [unclassified Streptomyces]|uniref:hypothetical protein n=1 Tax=unclassified Streptomyces TaxID=2593676 RepID=UPI000883065F|nr:MULTISPECIES: hypothetical protein [unclassified Streptomyces]PBC72334.1 hypothetical protein BX261_7418 [Streptomyces sp. 2321.6]SDR62134.1 hypothetical protein SAMN05216511_7285 [Streptomyces sp. KS_16]SEE50510.1 hypothetical protein SAMN05428940_7334 [Streptomyces sp. 2133.1]SNC77838.1 hypothetical protein SAMN06272741_7254 [Streptomyces sp. 2114.4]